MLILLVNIVINRITVLNHSPRTAMAKETNELECLGGDRTGSDRRGHRAQSFGQTKVQPFDG